MRVLAADSFPGNIFSTRRLFISSKNYPTEKEVEPVSDE